MSKHPPNLSISFVSLLGLLFVLLPYLVHGRGLANNDRNNRFARRKFFQRRESLTSSLWSSSSQDLSWRNSISHSPAHQDPAEAPAITTPDFDDTAAISISPAPRDLLSFAKRDALRCDDGPCIDDR